MNEEEIRIREELRALRLSYIKFNYGAIADSYWIRKVKEKEKELSDYRSSTYQVASKEKEDFDEEYLAHKAGSRVMKVGGSYQANGTIVASFKTLSGDRRYVFEFDDPKGMLHIFGPDNLAVLDKT